MDTRFSDERSRKFFSRYSREKLAKFKEFHLANPTIFIRFRDMAFQMKATGRSKYSAETIINALRWHTDLETLRPGGEEFKISNDYRSIYARLLAYKYPEFESFFSFKGMGDEDTETVDRPEVIEASMF